MRPHRRQPTRIPHPWDFPGKSTGVGCHCLLCSWLQSISFPYDYVASSSILGVRVNLLSLLLWNAIRVHPHANQQLLSGRSIWMQLWILRRKWFSLWFEIFSILSPPTYIYISCILNRIIVKCFITEAQLGGQALGNLFTDKCIIHKLDLIIQNLHYNHTPWGNSFHKPKWLDLKEWCGRKERKL